MPDAWTPATAPRSTELAELKAIEIVELDIGYCENTYGTSPCTASIPTTGAIKCFNCVSTCQDSENYAEETVTLRFAKASTYFPESGIEAIASIVSVDYAPAVLDPGESLGTRASIRIQFKDHPHSDTGPGFDKYWDERPYNPYLQGSFWSKFRARQPYLAGEAIRWKLGFLGDDLADFETRHFIVESFNGPTPEGIYTLVAKDPLKLLDGDRAQAPGATTGKAAGTVTDSGTSVTLDPAGVGAAQYPASGEINYGGKEVVSFTRSGDVLTITRAQYNTTGVAHGAEERLQLCLEYVAEDPADVIYDLMVNYGGVPAPYIDLDAWQTETATYFGRNVATLVTEPTSINALIAELCQQCGLVIWWDDVNQRVRLQVLRQISTDALLFDDSNVVKGSLRVIEQPNMRVSRSYCRYARNNPLLAMEEEFNYRSWEIGIDADAEANYGQPKIADIYSRWIDIGGRTTATRANDLKIGRYTDPPRKFGFSLFRGSVSAPVLGGGYLLSARVLQDATGAAEQVPIQIVSIRPTATGWDVEALEMRYTSRGSDDLSQHPIIIDSSANNLNLRTVHDNIYSSLSHGDTIDCTISAGAIVGSTSTGLRAFTIDASDFLTLALTGNRTSGSAVITGISDTTGLKAGQFVTGTGIPALTKILTVDSGTQVTLDANATSGTATATSLTFYTVIINLIVKGRIQGMGGIGGLGGSREGPSGVGQGYSGGAGGPALYVRYPINLILNEGAGDVHGGGGGGGGGGVLFLDNHRGGGGGGGSGTNPGAGGPVQPPGSYGTGEVGQPGTLDAGGTGGRGMSSPSWSIAPSLRFQSSGGTGGGPGLSGATGNSDGASNGGSGGAAGAAIDGVSYVEKTGTGDIRGSQIN